MKTHYRFIILALIVFLINACDPQYIDPISQVNPGPDMEAPQITINFPPDGYELQTNDDIATINIDFTVTDDIEIDMITLEVDAVEIATFSNFTDYRVANEEYLYDNVTTGLHTLTVTAFDIDGKSTTEVVSFSKAPPYVPQFEGEVFYIPFNNEFREMNSLELATVVGSPTFDDGIQGGAAYKGFQDSYLTFPIDFLQGTKELSACFWLNINSTPDRAGILVVSPPDASNNLRTSGFRFFRENASGMQRFKLNVGDGTADTWFDGGTAADVTPDTDEWVHFAFTIAESEAIVYINGEVVKQGTFNGIDWTNCTELSIMSGAPNFTGWNHWSDQSLMDELRIFNQVLTQDDIRTIILKEKASLYLDFNGDYKDALSGDEATVVGSPGFEYGGGVEGDAYKGATDAYLTFPATDLQASEFSASFWMNINATPDRAGILVMGPEDTANPDAQNDRTSGFRFFRENAGGMQRFKLNVGNGTADTWFDGGTAADVDPTTGNWVHFAFAIGTTEARVYINGTEVKQGDFTGVDWTGCDILSIMSGAPRFTGWNHWSDEGLMDELYLFKEALSVEEVTLLMNDGL